MMRRRFWFRTAIGLAFGLAACADGTAATTPGADDTGICTVADGPRTLADVPEASGVTLSRRTPGLLWSHNDSGPPVLFAFDAAGQARGRVRIPNAAVDDWEDVTAARCAAGNCLYVADIGDNNSARPRITLYRLPEPQPGQQEAPTAEIFTATYPEGARDAEALFVAGDDVFIITKEATAGLYRFPKPLRAGTDMRLERVAELPLKLVTDAEASADGAWVAVRTKDELVFYRTTDLVRGNAGSGITVSLRSLDEPQGEGVALDEKGTVYLTSEGGGRGGSLRALRCTLP